MSSYADFIFLKMNGFWQNNGCNINIFLFKFNLHLRVLFFFLWNTQAGFLFPSSPPLPRLYWSLVNNRIIQGFYSSAAPLSEEVFKYFQSLDMPIQVSIQYKLYTYMYGYGKLYFKRLAFKI